MDTREERNAVTFLYWRKRATVWRLARSLLSNSCQKKNWQWGSGFLNRPCNSVLNVKKNEVASLVTSLVSKHKIDLYVLLSDNTELLF